ncbi:MAG: tyrosine-type recombinase/integrase [Xanthobacteraceae bacterium]
MPRSKPLGWPKLMVAKRLKSNVVAYYWAAPTWAKKNGCPVVAEALGNDYATAKRRCDEILNPQFDAWRTSGHPTVIASRAVLGSFDWMVALYKSSPRYRDLPFKTHTSYDAALQLVSNHKLKDGRLFGTLSLSSITPGAADRLFAKLKERPGGGERVRTAVLSMRVCQRAWNVARRDKPEMVPAVNPFEKMGLSYKAKPTRPVTHAELVQFLKAADELGDSSIGTAAMIAFFWLQREADILHRLSWVHYRPADAPEVVRIFHQKTRELVELPLVDDDGTPLWPELTARLDSSPRHGTLIVMRDRPDRRRKVRLPWTEHYFRHRVAEIRAAAGINAEAKFMGLRHGGNTEGADAGLTDAQLRALSGHRSANMTVIYARDTMRQRRVGARRRLEARTNKGNLSE